MRLTAIFFLLSFAAIACAQEQGQSIMFKDKKSEYDHLTTLPEGGNKNLGDECMEMSRQIEQLKGKPQRRHALKVRFRLECQNPQFETPPAIE